MRQKTILVLFGGCSTEHDISLQSAQGVLEHMDRSRWLPLMVGITCQGEWLCYNGPVSAIGDGSWEQDRSHCTPCTLSLDRDKHQLLLLGDRVSRVSFDGAFPILHGKNGEDGTVQGLLELAGIPFAGNYPYICFRARFSAGGCAEVMLLRSSSTSLTVRVSSSRTPVNSLLNCAYRPVGAACSVRLCIRSNRSLTVLKLDAIRLSTLLMPSRSWTVLDSAIELTSLVSSYPEPFVLPHRAQCTKR